VNRELTLRFVEFKTAEKVKLPCFSVVSAKMLYYSCFGALSTIVYVYARRSVVYTSFGDSLVLIQ